MNDMAKYLCKLILLFSLTVVQAQDGFEFNDVRQETAVIRFEMINNLIFIPVEVNGVLLNFLLDTGVEQTVLFSLDESPDINFFNIQKIKMSGLGNAESIDGLKSSSNVLRVSGLTDKSHDIYLVLDQDFNFSSNIGVPVNGILGYHFFKNHLIGINYDQNKITVYKDNFKVRKRLARKFLSFPITLEKNKPYAYGEIVTDKIATSSKLLVDTGNSDAVWIFPNNNPALSIASDNFEDYLGRGFSGNIYGKRARISKFKLDDFVFDNPLVAFPNLESISNVAMVEDRVGSIGGEILKRFEVIFDYSDNKLFLRKGHFFTSPFHFNMSGIDVHHDGMTWVKEKVAFKTTPINSAYQTEGYETNSAFRYKFTLKPIFVISNVRKGSVGDLAGLLKGDVIVSINRKVGYKYSLEEISSLLKSEEGKNIIIEIERNGILLKFAFKLKNIL